MTCIPSPATVTSGLSSLPAVVPVTVEEKSFAAGKRGFLENWRIWRQATEVDTGEVGRNPGAGNPKAAGKPWGPGGHSKRHGRDAKPAEGAAAFPGGNGQAVIPRAGGTGRQQDRTRPPAEDVARWREHLIGQIQYNSVFALKRNSQRIIALVGATGVGKTTTVAKIAAYARLHMGLKVGLVSMDCYRIGATDQLRTYARIMHMPCEVALREKDLPRVIGLHSECDLILIDTAGKSPYDEEHVGELARWFAGVRPRVEPYLTISATTKKEDLKAVFEKYGEMHVTGLILTKLDETRAYATLCQQLAAGKVPVSCLCTGQRVPEDLMQASEETVGLLFREGWRALMGRWAANPAISMENVAV